jgi:homoserine kinase type II
MSVFTKVSHRQLKEFLGQYRLGELLGFQGIGEGVENTNYYVDTADGRWVLTLFERLNHRDLPFFLGLMDHLARRHIPCPRPLPTRSGRTLTRLRGKPAALVQRLTGQSVLFPSVRHCAAVGRLLGHLHLAGRGYPLRCRNSRGADWRRATAAKLLPAVNARTKTLIRDELTAQAGLKLARLPQGVIHADLFKDNVLFVGRRLSGVIDFYYACNDALLYDLAVTVNDWCFTPSGRFSRPRADALLAAYAQQRKLTAAERKAWPLTLRAAAFRFYLSRLHDWHFPRKGDVVHVKDPAEYGRILEYHRQHPAAL